MKAVYKVCSFTLRQMSRDPILILMIFAPLLAGSMFKWGLPAGMDWLSLKGISLDVSPYQPLIDSLLAYLTPSLFCIISSFLMLEERDEGISHYFFITPLGRRGYLIARLLIPAVVAWIYTLTVLEAFNISDLSIGAHGAMTTLGTLYAVSLTLVVVSLADNKVEGLALTKLTGVTFLAVLAPWGITGNGQYLYSFLPSFWLGKMSLAQSTAELGLSAALGTAVSLVWISLLWRLFEKRS